MNQSNPAKDLTVRKHRLKALKVMGSAFLFTCFNICAQPTPVPTTGDAPCAPEPSGLVLNDTVVSTPDQEGYLSLFDGTLKGWWQSCLTNHSSGDRTKGAAFRIGSWADKPVLYSSQHSQDGSAGGVRDGVGGILMTHKIFTNYELIFDFWPDYPNDGGVFNRTTAQGVCFQTVLDHIGAGSVGGTWGEGGYVTRDIRPWTYNSETSISIPSGPNGWTAITAANNPQSYGCKTSGCEASDYLRLWDVNGWNQMKIQFYGGSAAGTGNIHMKSWFRKVGETVWVPIIADTTLSLITKPGYLGLQVHSGTRGGGVKGNWYKNIMWRPLDDKGNVIKPPVALGSKSIGSAFSLSSTPTHLVGFIEKDFSLSIQDLKGKNLETFRGVGGPLYHLFRTSAHGWLSVQIKTENQVKSLRIFRD